MHRLLGQAPGVVFAPFSLTVVRLHSTLAGTPNLELSLKVVETKPVATLGDIYTVAVVLYTTSSYLLGSQELYCLTLKEEYNSSK